MREFLAIAAVSEAQRDELTPASIRLVTNKNGVIVGDRGTRSHVLVEKLQWTAGVIGILAIVLLLAAEQRWWFGIAATLPVALSLGVAHLWKRSRPLRETTLSRYGLRHHVSHGGQLLNYALPRAAVRSFVAFEYDGENDGQFFYGVFAETHDGSRCMVIDRLTSAMFALVVRDAFESKHAALAQPIVN